MNGVASGYEFEALPELGAGYESEFEGDRESEQFFAALANLACSGDGWLTVQGSPRRHATLILARQAINQGLPALGRWVEGQRPPGSAGLFRSRNTNGRASSRLARSGKSILTRRWSTLAMRRLKPKTRLKPRVWLEHDSVSCSRHSTSGAHSHAGDARIGVRRLGLVRRLHRDSGDSLTRSLMRVAASSVFWQCRFARFRLAD
jgi:hypothetical protein